jgi:hypothetical protein
MLSGPDAASVTRDTDGSWLDFTPAEAFDLAMRLVPLSSEIKFQVRTHASEEPTFRVSCLLSGKDDVLRELVELESVGIRATLQAGHAMRLGHLQSPPQAGTGTAGQ